MIRIISRSISSTKYHKLADFTLESLVESLDTLGDSLDLPSYDVELSVYSLDLNIVWSFNFKIRN